MTVAMTYMFGAVLLAGGCTREESAAPAGREAVILSIAEANYGALGGARRTGTSPADGGTPQTRAIVDGGGSTFFTDRDRLGLFLRGEYDRIDELFGIAFPPGGDGTDGAEPDGDNSSNKI